MSVEIEIATVFRFYFNGRKTVTTEGKTVGECLKYLTDEYPLTKNMFINDEGTLQNHFEVNLNGKSIYPAGANTAVKDGDKLDLVYIISGG